MSETVTSRAVRAGGSLVRHLRTTLDPSSSQPAGGRRPSSGWLAVTVLCEPSDLDEAALPAPLAELADRVEVRVRPAAGDKGTELCARLRDRPRPASAAQRLSGDDEEGELRSALRRAKQLIEVGEVLRVDPTPHGKRTPTPTGALLESWTKAAPEGGVR
ncbi:hypothetical protein G5V58_06100 [Nocardioides anomalus]|uniref:Uncharacterized protein n=1 Tax=Nocardioides anomalus TaxID=2712223 RepID=A0A6G6WBI3_9ACTN|nr:hypothetical protein [Nocardioides anomalus]QIG42400.1 hypothetical protein G5V58_06100 [Nocardioides anomalus]